MMTITHKEVRRHPRWREELSTPIKTPKFRRPVHWLVGFAIMLIVVAAVAVLMLKGWMSTVLRD